MNNIEATIADNYRKYRPLARPKTNVFTVVKGLFYIIIIATFLSSLISVVYMNIADVTTLNIIKLLFQIEGIILFLLTLVCHKRIVLLFIELYQHYASEKTRRKCICMPSCSVYALMVLRKYNIFKALYLIINRLSNCSGSVAFIDYP